MNIMIQLKIKTQSATISLLSAYIIISIVSTAGSHISFQGEETSDETNPSIFVSTCKTPDGLQGVCIDLFSCDPILNLLRQKPLSSSIVSHLRKSVCKRKAPAPDVCCPKNIGKPELISFGLVSFTHKDCLKSYKLDRY